MTAAARWERPSDPLDGDDRLLFDRVRRLEHDAWYRLSGVVDESFLYAVRAADDGPIKLGRSKSPKSRISSLQTSSPVGLRVLQIVPEWTVSEADAHERWAHLRLSGEWFEPHPELLAWLDSLPSIHERRRQIRERLLGVIGRREARILGTSPYATLERKAGVALRRAAKDRERAAKAALRLRPCSVCATTMTTGWTAYPGGQYACRSCDYRLKKCARVGSDNILAQFAHGIVTAEARLADAKEALREQESWMAAASAAGVLEKAPA